MKYDAKIARSGVSLNAIISTRNDQSQRSYRMNKYFFGSLALILFFSSYTLGFADEMKNAVMVKAIHEAIIPTFADKCKKDMTTITNTVCDCLAKKSEQNLNDKTLSNCPAGASGETCISNEVARAILQAVTKENIAACTASPTAASAPAAVAPEVAPEPAAVAPEAAPAPAPTGK